MIYEGQVALLKVSMNSKRMRMHPRGLRATTRCEGENQMHNLFFNFEDLTGSQAQCLG